MIIEKSTLLKKKIWSDWLSLRNYVGVRMFGRNGRRFRLVYWRRLCVYTDVGSPRLVALQQHHAWEEPPRYYVRKMVALMLPQIPVNKLRTNVFPSSITTEILYPISCICVYLYISIYIMSYFFIAIFWSFQVYAQRGGNKHIVLAATLYARNNCPFISDVKWNRYCNETDLDTSCEWNGSGMKRSRC